MPGKKKPRSKDRGFFFITQKILRAGVRKAAGVCIRFTASARIRHSLLAPRAGNCISEPCYWPGSLTQATRAFDGAIGSITGPDCDAATLSLRPVVGAPAAGLLGGAHVGGTAITIERSPLRPTLRTPPTPSSSWYPSVYEVALPTGMIFSHVGAMVER